MAMPAAASSMKVAHGKGLSALSFQGEEEGRGIGKPQVRENIAAREKADRQAQD